MCISPFLLEDLLDTTLASPRRVAVPVLIRNGQPCHQQQRFPLPSSSSSSSSSTSVSSSTAAAAVPNQHIHGQSVPTTMASSSSSNSSLVLSSCKNDTPSTLLYHDRQHMKYDNMDFFQQFLLSQWALSKKLFFPTPTWTHDPNECTLLKDNSFSLSLSAIIYLFLKSAVFSFSLAFVFY